MSLSDIKNKMFMFYRHMPGQLIELPAGKVLMTKLQRIIRNVYKEHGFLEVSSATFGDETIWNKTGHLNFFKDHMFHFDDYYMKPMNCPMHMLIIQKLYDEYSHFPIKVFEFNYCYRKELSGSLYGLNRLLRFTQDDSHQVINKQDILVSLNNFVNTIKYVYSKLNIHKFMFRLSNVSDDYAINNKLCNQAYDVMKQSVDSINVEYYETDDGAFYGPKLDVIIMDSLNREWQTGTFQVDFCLLKNINFKMRNKDTINNMCVIHHAFLGTFERFVGVLLDTKETLPAAINPFKYYFILVHNKENIRMFFQHIKDKYLNVTGDNDYVCDNTNANMNEKVKKASLYQYEYIIFIGDIEVNNNSVTFREKGSCKHYKKDVVEFFNDALNI